jgi:hypothetical protein
MTYHVHRVRRPHNGQPVPASPCVCTPDRLCLFHYDRLDPGRQARERERAGMHEPYIRTRR